MNFHSFKPSHFPFLKSFLSTLDRLSLFRTSCLSVASFGSWYFYHLPSQSSAFNHFYPSGITFCSVFTLFKISHILNSAWPFFYLLLDNSVFFLGTLQVEYIFYPVQEISHTYPYLGVFLEKMEKFDDTTFSFLWSSNLVVPSQLLSLYGAFWV